PTSSVTSNTSASPTTTTLVYDGTCDNVKDGDIVCQSRSSFNFCVGAKFLWTTSQQCAPGTVCCKDTNKCDFDFNCPSIPKDTTDRCFGKADNSIICTATDKFQICTNGRSNLFPAQSCQPGLVCCEALNRCDTTCPGQPLPPPQPIPVQTSTSPTVPSSLPGPTNCAGQGDGNIVCKTLKTFNFCIDGQFLTTRDLTCPDGTVCCASSQSCDWQFNCKSVRPTIANPPPAANPAPTSAAPIPTILPATCQGRTNGNIICTSGTTFNFCIDNAPVNSQDQSCPPGTVCCQAKNTCDFASNCPPVVVVPPSPSPSPSPSPVFSSPRPSPPSPSPGTSRPAITTTSSAMAPTVPYGSCAGAAAGALTCVSSTSFKYCLSDGLILDTNPQPCPLGTICCASKRGCVRPNDCSDPLPTLSSQLPAPSPTSIFNRLCGNSYTGLKCTSKTTFNFCEAGVLNNAVDQTCAGGLVCCPTTGGCTFESQCPIAVGAAAQDYVPPVPVYTGPGVAAKVCTGVLDGAVICLTDKEFNYCLSDGPLLPLIRKTCVAGGVCCATTGVCQLPETCPSTLPPAASPISGGIAPIAIGEPNPSIPSVEGPVPVVASPTPTSSNSTAGTTKCVKADMNTLLCRGDVGYEVCTGEG
ncbi:hypothetical protein HDU96_007420, partial [Phlyctochytrium bullatum]